jgi:hypothetical protein
MLADSVISTMKVERPPARSSAAPMRVKIWSMGPTRAAARRHERTHVRQQRDQRHLAHVGGLAAHVRAGDEQQARAVGDMRVIGDEMLDLLFHHRMAAASMSRPGAS